MTYLTIGWVLLTLPIFLIGMGMMDETNPPDYATNASASILIFVTAWWSVYFLIRWIVS